jgi:hypothetical protein
MAEQFAASSIAAPGFLKCSSCKEYKELDLFPKANNKKRGYAWICKVCKKEKLVKKKNSMTAEEWKQLNKKYWIKCDYGITLDDYNNKLKEQNHKCAICKTDEVDTVNGVLHVDHCHTTKQVRGLLCLFCNTALGKFKDSEDLMQEAINYLRKHKNG